MKARRLNTFLVIPTIRNLDFLSSWGSEFKSCSLIVVEDNEKKLSKVENKNFLSTNHYSHKDIDFEFKKNSWIFSRKNAGIRSYGFWKAYELGADIIITLDDDCYPSEEKFVQKHLDNLDFKMPDEWVNTYPNPKWMFTRGIPYSNRNKIDVAVSHGLWSGALDLDAKTEIKLPKLLNERFLGPTRNIIPFGYFYPMCSMNLAFKREVAPLMFFPMMGTRPDGSSWPYDRYDDIWAGIFSKKIMDHLGLGVISGSPYINHQKASKVEHNHAKEKAGMKINEYLWKQVEAVKLTKSTPKECYIELAKKIEFPNVDYFKKLSEAMVIWANLF